MEGWGFRLLSGRRGAEGYIGGMEGERRLHASGLCPGETYQLYAAGTGRCLGSRAADSRGCLTWEAPEGVFLACGEQVMLWEKGAQGYSRAIHFLQRTDQLKEDLNDDNADHRACDRSGTAEQHHRKEQN